MPSGLVVLPELVNRNPFPLPLATLLLFPDSWPLQSLTWGVIGAGQKTKSLGIPYNVITNLNINDNFSCLNTYLARSTGHTILDILTLSPLFSDTGPCLVCLSLDTGCVSDQTSQTSCTNSSFVGIASTSLTKLNINIINIEILRYSVVLTYPRSTLKTHPTLVNLKLTWLTCLSQSFNIRTQGGAVTFW